MVLKQMRATKNNSEFFDADAPGWLTNPTLRRCA